MSANLDYVNPWFHVSIATTTAYEERDFVVQAPNARQAIVIALCSIDTSQDEGQLHEIHVGKAMETPTGTEALGWHNRPTNSARSAIERSEIGEAPCAAAVNTTEGD